MCGIAGFLRGQADWPEHQLEAAVEGMSAVLHYRGPDDAGTWVQPSLGLALGHRRLSILDLSPLGHQPMRSRSGRYCISYNGEVYNHLEIRQELIGTGHKFRGSSDTETMLAAFEEWGIAASIRKFVGMFACAIWDVQETALFLVRDRLGIKPLYYGWVDDDFVFASELKAIARYPGFQKSINRAALGLFLEHSYVPEPFSIYERIWKQPPGTIIKRSHQGDSSQVHAEPYWSIAEVARNGESQPFTGSDDEARIELERRLRTAVRLRMLADVPVGAFLSGGIDSSTVVALMQAESRKPVKTFSIGFREPKYNEAEYAREVARHLQTDHVEHYVSPEEAREVIPLLPEMFDEPFGDSSQIPTYLVSRLAREQVTVSLSGDGGDELFCGYNRYDTTAQVWRKLRYIPSPLRRFVGQIGRRCLPRAPTNRFLRKLATACELFGLADLQSTYLRLHSHWKRPERLVGEPQLPVTHIRNYQQWGVRTRLCDKLCYIDMLTYLPDDILTKVDRASMAVSLEARVPILDHRVVEFAWTLPEKMKVRNGESKWLLRRVLDRYVPKTLVDRPKVGFGVPLCEWLRGPLKDWGNDLLSDSRLKRQGYFVDSGLIRDRWAEHQSGVRDWSYELWDVLMFQAWLA